MKAVYKFFVHGRIRLGYALSLIFFVLFIAACTQDEKQEIRIEWENEQAKGIIIPMHLLKDDDSVLQLLTVRLERATSVMLGDYHILDDEVLFQPLVPLTRGLNYEVIFRDKLIGRIAVPQADASQAPGLVAIYPSADTLPENLLKVYLQFSTPMQEGVALQNIVLLNELGDTLPNVFLNLQQELWNNERTVLTLWLDPGRIKRDLIPNQEMGKPLQKGNRYALVISDQWKSAQGLPLQQSYNKAFFAGGRDDAMPRPEIWDIKAPEAGSKQALKVGLNEPLDYFLLQETITVLDEKGDRVTGTVTVSDKEKRIAFIPENRWQKGGYHLRIASHLEDFAGNNLVRPFDRDITRQVTNKEERFFERGFVVK
jgi:hypothetical protein